MKFTIMLLAALLVGCRSHPVNGIAIKVCDQTSAIIVTESDGSFRTLFPPFDEYKDIDFKHEFNLQIEVLEGCEKAENQIDPALVS